MTTALVVRKDDQLGNMLNKPAVQGILREALPKVLDPVRFSRMLMTTVAKNDFLAKCDVQSIVQSAVEAAGMGLEIDGRGQAYLVPYWNKNKGVNEAQLQIGYKGLMDLAIRAGNVSHFAADVVYRGEVENGSFVLEAGTEQRIVHRINPLMPELREKEEDIIGAYAVAVMVNGQKAFKFVDRTFIEKRRSASKSKGFSPWASWYAEMCIKTAIKALVKTLRLSPEVQRAVMLDDQAEAGEDQEYSKPIVVHSEPSAPENAKQAVNQTLKPTDEQRKAIMAYYSENSMDRGARLFDMSKILGREVSSFNDINRDEASRILGYINEVQYGENNG